MCLCLPRLEAAFAPSLPLGSRSLHSGSGTPVGPVPASRTTDCSALDRQLGRMGPSGEDRVCATMRSASRASSLSSVVVPDDCFPGLPRTTTVYHFGIGRIAATNTFVQSVAHSRAASHSLLNAVHGMRGRNCRALGQKPGLDGFRAVG